MILKSVLKFALQDFINRRFLTEFGNMALVESREELEGGDVNIRLPGVKAGDMADRKVKPEVSESYLKEERGMKDKNNGDENKQRR